METIKAILAFPFTNTLNLLVIVFWIVIGATFYETIRRAINKISGGRFFGKAQSPAEVKATPQP